MELKIKNNELVGFLNVLNGYENEKQKCKGLKNENVSLGVKVRLNKIEKIVLEHYKEVEGVKNKRVLNIYPEGISKELEFEKSQNKDEAYIDLIREINELYSEEFVTEIEPIEFSKVENLESEFDYTYFIGLISE